MQNGICAAFDAKIRDELLPKILFFARSAVARWIADYESDRPHSAPNDQTLAAYAKLTAMGDRRRHHEPLRRPPLAAAARTEERNRRTPASAE